MTNAARIVVVLPENAIGCASAPDADGYLDVFHKDLPFGRGPWPMHPTQVRDATPEEIEAYEHRSDALARRRSMANVPA